MTLTVWLFHFTLGLRLQWDVIEFLIEERYDYSVSALIKRNITVWNVSKYGVFSGPYFPAFGLNTEKIRTRKNSVFGLFSWNTKSNNVISAWISFCKFAAYFQNTSDRMLLNIFETTTIKFFGFGLLFCTYLKGVCS